MVSDKRKLAFARRFTAALERSELDSLSGEDFSKLLARKGVAVTGQTVSNWRTGAHMPRTLEQFEALADVLNEDPGNLAFGNKRVAETRPVWGATDKEERTLVERIALLGKAERTIVAELVRLLSAKPLTGGRRAGRPRRKPAVD